MKNILNINFNSGEIMEIETKDNPNILLRKLTIEEQNQIIQPIFGFELRDVSDGHYVLFDEDGDEFYGYQGTSNDDFTTLQGILSYCAKIYKEKGYEEAQYDIRKSLGL